MPPEHPDYIYIYYSIGGWKSCWARWYEDIENYDAYMTGPGFEQKTQADSWGKSWAAAEEIEFRGEE